MIDYIVYPLLLLGILWCLIGKDGAFTKKKNEQRTWCYCPSCKNDLCSNGSFIEDTDLVRYKCTVCGNKSEWNFDIAPVALLIKSDEGSSDIKPREITL